ncbi:MAG: choice-of-anchor D domain-containing protein [Candidatus Kapaibacterium sp.]|nr:choice-of-anchor D domain-containing protein [Bacteroidota bacterium]
MVKHVLFVLMLMCSLTSNLLSQSPEINYLLPDIGAPGMAIYVEVYGPSNGTAIFSALDSIQPLNSPNIKLECVNNADTNKIRFGPLLVSWNGKLLSTVIFINPSLAPNSSSWSLLTPEFRIPIRFVNVNGTSNVDTFYIVKKTELGNITSNAESVLGQGTLGVRSKRGCIIVDSLILGNKTYSVSTNDPDGNSSNGNQGYLPFTLLSQGVIRGTGANTKISLNASGRDGGPGGGGGAGDFCDFVVSDAGNNGGNGYTGGGPGGKNSPDLDKGVGAGTSTNGTSLTKVLPGNNGSAHESSGGGTGHPFGKSGDGCSTGTNCSPSGYYGGGSGVSNSKDGAGAGFGTVGVSTSTSLNNGGQVNGNAELIPISGGSGGASGNPQNNSFPFNGCGGSGGGGGGGGVLSAVSINNISISANGADGSVGSSGGKNQRGGGGSGGGILLSSVLPFSDLTLNAIGGNQSTTGKGGDGRIRVDGIFSNNVIATPGIGHNGVTIDTITYTDKTNIPISGTGATSASIQLYYSPSNGVWQALPPVSVGTNNRWSTTINYTGNANYLYVVAMQRTTNLTKGVYEYVPAYTLSQQSARTVRIAHIAQISFPTERDLGVVNCTNGGTKSDTFLIKNTGSAPVTISKPRFSGGTEGFAIIEPIIPPNKTINGNDSLRVIVRFTQQPGKFGLRTDNLMFDTDDAANPFTSTTYKVKVDSVGLEFIDTTATLKIISAIDYDEVCSYSNKTRLIALKNIGKESVTIIRQRPKNTSSYLVSTPTKTLLQPSDSIQLHITLTTQGSGDYTDTLLVEINRCNLVYQIPLRAVGISTDIVGYGANGSGDVDFGDIRVGQSSKKRLVVKNEGNFEADIRNMPSVNTPYVLKAIAPDTIPQVLQKGDSIVFELDFSPVTTGTFTDSVKVLSVTFNKSCNDTVFYRIRGRGTKSAIVASKNQMNFDTVYSCSHKRDTVWLKNTGNLDATVKTGATIIGNDPTYFRIVSAPTRDTVLRPERDSIAIIVEFVPDTSKPKGAKSAILEIPTFDDSARTIQVGLNGYQKIIKISVTPNPLVLTDIPVNISTQSKVPIVITNVGDVKVCLSNVKAIDASVLTPIPPYALDFDQTVTRGIYLNIKPKDLNIINDTITLYFTCPCIDSIKLPFKGTPTNNALTFSPDSVYFGAIQPCTPTVKANPALTIKNYDPISKASILDVRIVGKDSALFSIQKFWPSFPWDLSAGNAVTTDMFFNPQGTRAGFKKAYLVFKYIINNQTILDSVVLTGHRLVPITTDSITMSFGSIKQGQTKTIPLTITNDSSRSLSIAYSFVGTTPGVFKPSPQTLSIAGKQSDKFNIEFSSTVVGNYVDTMFVKFYNTNQGCWDSIPVYMNGDIIPGLNFRVWLDSAHTFSPNDKKVKIGLWGKLDTTVVTLPQAQFQASIDFPADLFMPNDLNPKAGGVIQNFSPVANGRRSITINIDTTLNPIGPQAALLTEIIGDAMLGDTECDSAFISDIVWKNNGIRPTTWINKDSTGGKICMTICKDGGNRLISQSGLGFYLIVSPNPTQGDITIQFATSEKSIHEIVISTAEGKEVEKIVMESVALNQPQTLIKHTDSLANGLYFITLRSATQSKILPLMVTH